MMEQFGSHNWSKFTPDVKILLLCSFLIPFGSFMVLPFIPIFLNKHLNMPMSYIGWVLAAMSFIQFGGGLLGGIIAGRTGYKKTMLLALAIRTTGFVLLCLSNFVVNFAIPSVLLIASGAALYLPANKAYIVSHVSAENKALILSLSSSALNASMGLGPLIGGITILTNTNILFILATMLFFIVTILHLYFIYPCAQLENLKIELTVIEVMPNSPALGFGTLRLASGIGAAGSAILGGILFDVALKNNQLNDFWLWIAIQALFIIASYFMLSFLKKSCKLATIIK